MSRTLGEWKQRSKYNARKTEIDGIKFDSAKEAARYAELKLLRDAGKIKDLQLQVPFVLQEGFKSIRSGRKILNRHKPCIEISLPSFLLFLMN